MKARRITAYIIDIMIICLIITGLGIILNSPNLDILNGEMRTLNENLLSKEMGFITYLNHYSNILHDLDKQRTLINIVGIILMVIYFIIIPYFTKGRTFGKLILGIQVVKDGELTMNELIVRSLLINGLGYLLVAVLLIFILPAFSYFLTISILGFIQIVLVIASGSMILWKKDGKTLEDLITNTEVVLYKEVKE